MDADLRQRGSYLVLRQGAPVEILHQLLNESSAQDIYAEEDFTPYARQRDQAIASKLPLKLIQGQLVHHPLGIYKSNNSPYTVYSPFSKVWKNLLPHDLGIYQAPERIPTIPQIPSEPIPEHDQEKYFPVGEAQAQKRLEFFWPKKFMTMVSVATSSMLMGLLPCQPISTLVCWDYEPQPIVRGRRF